MASSKLMDVDPKALEQSAAKIEEKAKEFQSAYTTIFTAVTDMKPSFVGQAGDAYRQKVENYKSNFENMYKALTTYAEKVKAFAADVEKTDQNLAQK